MFFTLLLKNILILLKNYIYITKLISKYLTFNNNDLKSLISLISFLIIYTFFFPNITLCETMNMDLEVEKEEIDTTAGKIIGCVLITVGILILLYAFLESDGDFGDGSDFEPALPVPVSSIARPSTDPNPRAYFLVGLVGN